MPNDFCGMVVAKARSVTWNWVRVVQFTMLAVFGFSVLVEYTDFGFRPESSQLWSGLGVIVLIGVFYLSPRIWQVAFQMKEPAFYWTVLLGSVVYIILGSVMFVMLASGLSLVLDWFGALLSG